MKKLYWILLILLVITITTTAIVIIPKYKLPKHRLIEGGYICFSNNCLFDELLIFNNGLLTVIASDNSSSNHYYIVDNHIYTVNGVFKIVNQNIITGIDLKESIITGMDLGTRIYIKHNLYYDDYDIDYKKFLGKFTISTPKLNVRSGPGRSYTVIGTLKSGDSIDVIEIYPEITENELWERIDFNDQIGFIAKYAPDSIP